MNIVVFFSVHFHFVSIETDLFVLCVYVTEGGVQVSGTTAGFLVNSYFTQTEMQ